MKSISALMLILLIGLCALCISPAHSTGRDLSDQIVMACDAPDHGSVSVVPTAVIQNEDVAAIANYMAIVNREEALLANVATLKRPEDDALCRSYDDAWYGYTRRIELCGQHADRLNGMPTVHGLCSLILV